MLEGGWEGKVRSEGARAGGEARQAQGGPQALVDFGGCGAEQGCEKHAQF